MRSAELTGKWRPPFRQQACFLRSVFLTRWVRIFLITTGSSRLRHPASPYLVRPCIRMQARACPASAASALGMILTAPPHSRQVWISILKTRFSLCAQVMAARRSTGVWSCGSSDVWALFPFPRLAGVTTARCLLLGAKTPWKRVRLTRGLGTRAASRAMKSSGSKITPVVETLV